MSSEEEPRPDIEGAQKTAGTDREQNRHRPPPRECLRQKAERFEFSLLATEEDANEWDAETNKGQRGRGPRSYILRRRQSLKSEKHKNLWKRAKFHVKNMRTADDPFFDLPENYKEVVEVEGIKKVRIPSLLECRQFLSNPEADAHNQTAFQPLHILQNLLLNILAAFTIWFINMLSVETFVVAFNAAGAASYFGREKRRGEWELKLDFSFLAFAVVFPLTFLISSTFARREQAFSFLADFKSSVLSAALMTLSVDWPNDKGDLYNGRLQLPERFNRQVAKDFRELVKLVYEYLSMPQVAHGRNHVFWNKQRATKRVHALQNGIVQDINDYMYDFAIHTEDMKRHGFPSGEASRLHQYHQYVRQRFEHLRQFKYYRTPQATRSFGRVYIFVLPWMSGPYWAWVAEGTHLWFSIILSAFTFLVLLGLLNAQNSLEDPFVADHQSLMPGIDTIKLDFEMAVTIQAIEQYYVNAELQRVWELSEHKDDGAVNKDMSEDVQKEYFS
jgi:hypothetical protein